MRVALALSMLATCCLWAADDWEPPDLVQNPGFEQTDQTSAPVEWDAPGAVYSTVTSPTHSGGRALQFVNDNPDRYVLCSQKLPLEPGSMYEVSAWVKTEGIQGEDTGATVCLEWYDAEGVYLGGHYPPGVKGDSDWRVVRSQSGRVHARAATCTVTCYVRQGMTGKAWWDDVSVRRYRESPLATLLTWPAYRGEMTRGPKRIVVRADLSLRDYGLELSDTVLRLYVADSQGRPTGVSRELSPPAESSTVTLSARDLPSGAYTLHVTLLAASTGRQLASEQWRIRVPDPRATTPRTSYIDRHGRLIRDGKPFFPLGMYWSGINQQDIEVYATGAFNCLMPYGAPTEEQMALAHSHGLKVIYSVKDIYHGSKYCPESIKSPEDERPFIEGKARQFADHPALLAWYLNDELPVRYMERLEAHQQWLEELDPNHPTWVVLYQVGTVGKYARTCDVMGTDPYPIPSSPARRAADWTRLTIDAFEGSKAVWMVPQVFNWAVYRKDEAQKKGLRPPTFEEMRSMSWQCIAEGARGLIYYSFFDIKRDELVPFEEQWGYCKQMAAEISDMIPVIMSVEQAPLIRASSPEWLHWTTRQVEDTTYLIAVNDEGRRHLKTFRLPATPRSISLRGGDGPIRLRGGNRLTAMLEPFAVHIYELEF